MSQKQTHIVYGSEWFSIFFHMLFLPFPIFVINTKKSYFERKKRFEIFTECQNILQDRFFEQKQYF